MSDESIISQVGDALKDVMADGKIDSSDIARVLVHFIKDAPGVAIPVVAAAVPGAGAALEAAEKVGLDPAKLIGHLKALKKG